MSDTARNFLILMLSGRFGGPNMAVITPYRLDDRCGPHADTVGCVRSDCSGPRPLRLSGPAKVDQGVLELLDLACVKINKPKPRRLSLIMCRFQSTNVSVTGIHSSAPSRFSDVPGVAAAGRPRLMIFLTVVPQSRPHPFGERGKAIAVPFLQRLTGERLTGSVALISENSDLVHQVGMLRPARTPLGHQSVVCETGISDARIAIGLLIRSLETVDAASLRCSPGVDMCS